MATNKIKFDSEQKYDGFNKYGHYQFGYLTCPYCRNSDTDPIRDGGEWQEKKARYCFACTGKFIPKHE